MEMNGTVYFDTLTGRLQSTNYISNFTECAIPTVRIGQKAEIDVVVVLNDVAISYVPK